MRIRLIAAATAMAVAAAFVLETSALAQEAPPVGAQVKDKNGAGLGVVEKVVSGPDGKPYQVLVRQGSTSRPLLVEGLVQKGGAFISVLSKAEFEILPAAQ